MTCNACDCRQGRDCPESLNASRAALGLRPLSDDSLTSPERAEAHAYIAVAAWVVAAFLAAFVIASRMHN